ncbi:MAG TPA: hypothetical protein VHF47_03855 [Acidimicrobiales bacterium]|nr:hypothetical protein [Acidimicrobiales bacterium]
MRRRTLTLAACAAALAAILAPAKATPVVPVARSAEPVVLTGSQLPDWSRLPAEGTALPWPSGALDGVRDAHHGTLTVPPDVRTGVDPDQIVAYKWNPSSGKWAEVPVQVDERFPYFLANANSDFAMYSAVDEELTYAWDTERWNMTAGSCTTAHPPGVGTMADPVPTLDDDDEIVFMADDAGVKAPADATRPKHTTGDRQEIALADPLDPTKKRYVYLYRKSSGPSAPGYVTYTRDANADQWIDRNSFAESDPEKLGTSNTPYGPNLSGDVCDPDGTVRTSTDRFPRDGVTVATEKYTWRATGRWMVRSMQVANAAGYGADLIDRWKGRAFQQSPDSSISVVGFEDEQVNWEANSSLLGERVGPVRAIREVWGADSGTNVTKTETFYRDAVTYRYHLRVHPIPPDGLYTSWDYNHGTAVRYYNTLKPNGVDIDGTNDDVGNVDTVGGRPAFFDMNDPTFNVPSAILNWEQVSGSGDNGSLVYLIELKNPTSLENPAVVPYYRDDKCLDDGTGDDPVARPWPGEASTDPRVIAGYEAANGGTPYAQLTCDQKQGAWGSHGVHFFFTGDTDNAFTPKPVTELDAQQWQFAVPTAAPTNVGDPYANTVKFRLVPTATPQPGGP